MTSIDAVGWLLLALIGGLATWHFIKRPSSIEIEMDGIRTRGLASWSDQEHFLFADMRRFEERYSKPFLSKQGSWRLYVVTLEDGREVRHELPNYSATSFSMLKNALAEWQSAHGCLPAIPLADMSELVRY